jgi:hypothetical protein
MGKRGCEEVSKVERVELEIVNGFGEVEPPQ